MFNSGMAGVRQFEEQKLQKRIANGLVKNSMSPEAKRSVTPDASKTLISKKPILSPEGTKYSLINRRESSSSNFKNAAKINTPNSNFIF